MRAHVDKLSAFTTSATVAATPVAAAAASLPTSGPVPRVRLATIEYYA